MNKKNKKAVLITFAILVIGYGIFRWQLSGDERGVDIGSDVKLGVALVSVTLPDQFSDTAIAGARIFESKCLSCHGRNASGQQDVAPPLIHKIYEPSHHSDESFRRAVLLGVRSHHWRFGDMPPVDGLTRSDTSKIITYIRELQRANGIN